MAAGETVNLGQLLLEMGLSTSTYYEELEDLRRKTLSYAAEIEHNFNAITLKPKTDEKALTKLNQHLDLKEKHLKQVNQTFKKNPLTPTTQLQNLDELEVKLQGIQKLINEINSSQISPNVSQATTQGIEGYQVEEGRIRDKRTGRFVARQQLQVQTQDQGQSVGSIVKEAAISKVTEQLTEAAINASAPTAQRFVASKIPRQYRSILGIEEPGSTQEKSKVQAYFTDQEARRFSRHFVDEFELTGEKIGRRTARAAGKGDIGGIFGAVASSAAELPGRLIGGAFEGFGEYVGRRVGTEFADNIDSALKDVRSQLEEFDAFKGTFDDLIPSEEIEKRFNNLSDAVRQVVMDLSDLNDTSKQLENLDKLGNAISDFATLPDVAVETRKSRSVQQSAGDAKALADQILKEQMQSGQRLQDIGDAKNVVFTTGGFAGQQGQRGLTLAPEFQKVLGDKAKVIGFTNPNFETRSDASTDPAGWAQDVAQNIAKLAAKGYNEDSVRLAAEAYAYKQQNPDAEITLAGHSAGGIISQEAAAILEQLGVKAKTLTLGTPELGFVPSAKNSPTQRVMGTGDAFGKVWDKQTMVDAGGHEAGQYLQSEQFQKILREFVDKQNEVGQAGSVSEQDLEDAIKALEELAKFEVEAQEKVQEFGEVYQTLVKDLAKLADVDPNRVPELKAEKDLQTAGMYRPTRNEIAVSPQALDSMKGAMQQRASSLSRDELDSLNKQLSTVMHETFHGGQYGFSGLSTQQLIQRGRPFVGVNQITSTEEDLLKQMKGGNLDELTKASTETYKRLSSSFQALSPDDQAVAEKLISQLEKDAFTFQAKFIKAFKELTENLGEDNAMTVAEVFEKASQQALQEVKRVEAEVSQAGKATAQAKPKVDDTTQKIKSQLQGYNTKVVSEIARITGQTRSQDKQAMINNIVKNVSGQDILEALDKLQPYLEIGEKGGMRLKPVPVGKADFEIAGKIKEFEAEFNKKIELVEKSYGEQRLKYIQELNDLANANIAWADELGREMIASGTRSNLGAFKGRIESGFSRVTGDLVTRPTPQSKRQMQGQGLSDLNLDEGLAEVKDLRQRAAIPAREVAQSQLRRIGRGTHNQSEVYLDHQNSVAYKYGEINDTEAKNAYIAGRLGVGPQVLSYRRAQTVEPPDHIKNNPFLASAFAAKQRQTAAMAMESIQGRSLDDLFGEGENSNTGEINQNLLAALEKLHKQGIAHGDLHGDNILADVKNQIKLIDFGQSSNDMSSVIEDIENLAEQSFLSQTKDREKLLELVKQLSEWKAENSGSSTFESDAKQEVAKFYGNAKKLDLSQVQSKAVSASSMDEGLADVGDLRSSAITKSIAGTITLFKQLREESQKTKEALNLDEISKNLSVQVGKGIHQAIAEYDKLIAEITDVEKVLQNFNSEGSDPSQATEFVNTAITRYKELQAEVEKVQGVIVELSKAADEAVSTGESKTNDIASNLDANPFTQKGKAIVEEAMNTGPIGEAKEKIEQLNNALQMLEQGKATAGEVFEVVKSGAKDLVGLIPKLLTISNLQTVFEGFVAFKLLFMPVVGLIKDFGPAAIDAAQNLEKFNRVVGFAAGSSSRAADGIKFVRSEVSRLSLDLNKAREGYAGLLASSRDTPLEGVASDQIFSGISQASSVYGLSNEDTQGIFLATQQIIGKNTVSSEELRQQIGERLPGAFNVAARAMGVTTQELNKLLESGQLTAEEFLPKFAQQLSAETSTGLVGASRSAQASLNRFNTSVTELQETLGKPLLDVKKLGLDALGGVFGGLAKNSDLLVRILSFLALAGFVRAGQAVLTLTGVLLGNKTVVQVLGLAWKLFSRTVVGALAEMAIPFALFTAISDTVAVFSTVFKDAGGAVRDFANQSSKQLEALDKALNKNADSVKRLADSYNDLDPKNLPTSIENMFIGKAAQGLFGDAGKEGVRNIELGLQNNPELLMGPILGPLANAVGFKPFGRLRTLAEKQSEDFNIATNESLGNANQLYSRAYSMFGLDGRGAGQIQQINSIDSQLRDVQSRRRTLSPNDNETRRQLQAQEAELLKAREEAAKPIGQLQGTLASYIEGLKTTRDEIQARLDSGAITNEEADRLKGQLGQVNNALEEGYKIQDRFNTLLGGSVDIVAKLKKEFQTVQAVIEDTNSNLDMSLATARRVTAEQEASGQLSTYGANQSRTNAEQASLADRINANRQAVEKLLDQLNNSEVQRVLQVTGVGPLEQTGPAQIRNRAEQLGDTPEAKTLNLVADQYEQLRKLQTESDQAGEQLSQSAINAANQIRETAKQINDFYRSIFRESQQIALAGKENALEIAALNAKAKLQSALTGFGNEFFGEFTDGIVNLVEQFFEPMRNSLQAQQQILSNDNRLQDTIMQGTELGRQFATGNNVMPGMVAGNGGSGGQIQVGAGGQIQTVSTGLLAAQEYGASRSGGARRHAGQDLDYGANDSAQSFLGGVVTRMGSDPGGYGNYIDIYNETLGVVERLAEMDNVLVQVGQQIASGQAVGRGTRDTGVIHYEIRTDVNGQRQGGFGYEGTVNPLEFLQSRGIAQRQGNQLIARNGQAIGIAQGEHFEGDGHDHGAMQSGGAGGAPQTPQMPRVQIPGASLNLAGSGGIVGQNSQFQVPARTRTAQTGWGGLSIMGNNAVARTQAQQPSGRRYVPRGGTVRRAERVQSDPEGARAMAATAQRLGLPVDQFAALMSWESAGSLNPNIVGGDNNAYQGLIQFSPENRQRYGIRPNMTIAEQMPAIERYLLDRGFKPGEMDIRGAYSAVLAGNASQRYWNRQDSNGTSVNNAAHRFRSGDHYDRARQFLAASGYTGAASAMVQAQQGGTGGMTPGMPGMALPPGVDPSQINAGMDLARSNAAAESQQIQDRVAAQNNLAGIQLRQQINRNRRSLQQGSLSLEDTTRTFGRQQEQTLAGIGPQTASRELDNSLRQAQQEFDDNTRNLQLKIRSAQEGVQDLQATLQFLREFSQQNPGSGFEALIPDTEQAIAKAQTELGNLQGLFDKEKDVFEQRRQFILEEAQRAEQTRKFEVQQSTLGLERNVFDAQAVQLRRNGMGEQAITQEGQLRTREINLDTQGRIRELDEQLRLERLTNEEYARQKALLEQLNSTSLANLQEELRRSREELAFNTQSEVFGSRQAIGQELVSGLNQQGFTTQANRVQAQMQREQVGFDLQSRLRQIDEMARSSGMAAEAVAQLRDNAQQLAEVKLDNINNQVSVMGQVVPAVQQGFQGFFSGILSGTQSVGEAFKGMLESILNNLANLASQLITNELFGGLFGMGNGNNMMGGGGGFLGMLTGKGGGGGGFGGVLPGKGAKGGGGGGFLGALLGGGDSGGGGFLGSLFSGVLSLFSEGGEVEPEDHRGYREGYGQISKALKKEGTRSVLAALTPGEIILNVHQAKRYKEMGGERIFNFAKGGMVPGVSAKPVGMPKAGTSINVNVPVNVSGGNESAVDVPGLQKVIDSRVQETLLREQRPGGTLNRSGKRQ